MKTIHEGRGAAHVYEITHPDQCSERKYTRPTKEVSVNWANRIRSMGIKFNGRNSVAAPAPQHNPLCESVRRQLAAHTNESPIHTLTIESIVFD